MWKSSTWNSFWLKWRDACFWLDQWTRTEYTSSTQTLYLSVELTCWKCFLKHVKTQPMVNNENLLYLNTGKRQFIIIYINVLFYHCTLHVCSPWSPYSTRQFHNYVISIFSFIRIKSGGGGRWHFTEKNILYISWLWLVWIITREFNPLKKKKEFFFSLFLTWISSTNFFVTTFCYGLVLDTNHKLTL